MTDLDSDSMWVWFFQFRLLRPFQPEMIRDAREALIESCRKQGIAEAQAWDLAAAADELVCNVLEHSSAAWLDLGVCQNAVDGMLRLRLLDNGERFDVAMAAAAMADAHSTVIERQLGLAMIKGLSKDLAYRSLPEGGNEVVFSLP